MTRYTATIAHHSIASARVVPVGDSLHQAKVNAGREFSGEMGEAMIEIIDTTMPIYGNDPVPGNQAVVASRRVDADGWA